MSKELDKLIEQMLNERLPYDLKGKEPSAIKRDLGTKLKIAKIKSLASKASKNDELEIDDFEKAYDRVTNNADVENAEAFRTASTNPEVKAGAEAAYKGSKREKAVDAKAQKDAIKQQATQASYNAVIKAAVDKIKTKSTLDARYAEYVDQYNQFGSPKRKKGADTFDKAFSLNDKLNLASMEQAGKIAIKGNPAVAQSLKQAVEARRQEESQGNITSQGYTSFLTNDINGANALTYSDTGKHKYNYTVLVNQAGPTEPWYLDGSDPDNIQRIARLLNNIDKAEVRTYLDFFHNQPANKIFIHNLKVFQAAIKSENISTKEGDLQDWWQGNMVARYQTITAADPKTTAGLERVALTDQPFMSQAAGEGRMLDSQFSMFKTFFEGTPTGANPLQTLSARVKKLTDFTKELYDAPLNEVTNISYWDLKDLNADGLVDKDKSNNQYVEYLNKIMIFDYFNAMAKELDAGAGPYVFEAFCAYLAGGRVAGKETGLKGGMGETDFFFDDGSKGSAKYLQTKSKFSQSADNFLQGVTVTYVFASKKGVDLQGSEKGESDPDKIHYIDLYVVDVTRLDQAAGDTITFNITAANAPKSGAPASQNINLKSKDTKVEFDVSTFDPVGRVFLVEKNKENIMSKLDALSEKMDNDKSIALKQFAELAKYFKSTFENLGEAREQVSQYSNTGDMKNGTEAKTAIGKANTDFDSVIKIVQAGNPVNENKSIDSLIETIIKKNLFK